MKYKPKQQKENNFNTFQTTIKTNTINPIFPLIIINNLQQSKQNEIIPTI